jgi:hypothetical protein
MRPSKIISGGQTGVDRAALDFAIERGIPHGGWCPLNRKAEDGRIPDRYELIETLTADYAYRTVKNIDNADATLIVSRRDLLDARGKFTGGTLLTARKAKDSGGGLAWVFVDDEWPGAALKVRHFVESFPCAITLNIAGPRESKATGIYAATMALLREAWA